MDTPCQNIFSEKHTAAYMNTYEHSYTLSHYDTFGKILYTVQYLKAFIWITNSSYCS